MQVAMYRLSHSSAGGFRLDSISSQGLYSLPGSLEQMLAFEDETWGESIPSPCLLVMALPEKRGDPGVVHSRTKNKCMVHWCHVRSGEFSDDSLIRSLQADGKSSLRSESQSPAALFILSNDASFPGMDPGPRRSMGKRMSGDLATLISTSGLRMWCKCARILGLGAG